MVLTSDQQRVKTLLTETITLLCKNGLQFMDELRVEALIGITVDQDEVFLVSLNEILYPGVIPVPGSSPAKSRLQHLKGKSVPKTVSSSRERLVSSTNIPSNTGEKGTKKLTGQTNSTGHSSSGNSGILNSSADSATQSAISRGKNLPANDNEHVSKKRRNSQALDDSQLVSTICNSLLAEPKARKIKSELAATDCDKEDNESSATTLLQDDDDEAADNVEQAEFLEQDSDNDGDDSLCPLDMVVDPADSQNLSGQRSSQSNTDRRTRRQTSIENSGMMMSMSFCSTEVKLDRLCPICGRCLRRACDLSDHIASVHGKQKLYFCDLCNRDFGYKHNFRRHMKGHICTESSTLKNSFKLHQYDAVVADYSTSRLQN